MFAELNDRQRAAVEHGDQPLLIVAGAGSGKTLTLAARLAALLERGAPPERTCLLTFSRRAAKEMKARAAGMAPAADARRVVAGTFHAVGSAMLRRHGRDIGVSPSFTVLDESDSVELMAMVRNDVWPQTGGHSRAPRAATLLGIYSRMINARQKLTTVVKDSFPAYLDQVDAIRPVFEAYTERKRAQQTFDFDDLLLYWHTLVRHEPDARPFDHVLVDEWQDTNLMQADIVAGLCPGGAGLTVVGDDAQAIYSFRGATVRNMLDFTERFAGATVVALEQNYRSTTPILALANAVMAGASEGHRKELWSQRPGQRRPRLRQCFDPGAEAEAVCDSVLAHREDGIGLRQQAVLFRAAWHSDQLEIELARRNVPFHKYGGLRFLEAAHVKDVLALLRVLDNPFDELAWFRSLQLIDGVGPAIAARVMDAIGVRQRDADNGDPMAAFLVDPLPVPQNCQAELDDLRAGLADCAGDDRLPPAVQVERLSVFLTPVVKRAYESPDARLADLAQLAQAATRFESRQRLLTDLVLDPPSTTSDLAGPPLLDDEYLTLSTVHSAKGGEWHVVHLIGATDGMFPSDMALKDRDGLDEERRLFYVAVTRARDVLEVSFPLRFYPGRGDRHGWVQASRFLDKEIRALMDCQQSGAGVGDRAADAYLADLLA